METKAILKITKDDIYKFNLYLSTLNKNLGMIMASTFIIILGIIGLIKDGSDALLLNLLTLFLGILGMLFIFVFNKLLIKRKIQKMDFDDLEPIEVTLNDEGILYRYESEMDKTDIMPYRWDMILRAVIVEEYAYIHLYDRRSIIIITLRDTNKDEVIEILKNKLAFQKRYFERKKG